MARNIEPAIKRAVTAKLRERGMSEKSADAVADKHAAAALKTFNDALKKHQAPTETAYEQSFQAVTKWAATLKP
jgi:hypothetical protein